MIESPQLWCVGGRQGSGKTTIATRLAQQENFNHLDRDTELRRLLSLYNEQTMLRALSKARYPGLREWRSSANAFISKFRADLNNYLRLLHWSGNENLLGIAKNIEDILQGQDIEALLLYSQPAAIATTYLIFSELKTLDRAIRTALKKEQPVLVNSIGFSSRQYREMTARLLRSQDIDPQLIIVRSTSQRLVAVARERNRDPDHLAGQANISSIGEFDPYHPDEGWSRVIVLDNLGDVDDVVRDVRQKIASNTDSDTTQQVSFLAK